MKQFLKIIGPPIIGLIVFAGSLFIYISADKHLTPSSVGVSGYYRQNGTYVRAYNRRPPGGAKHDAPYENVMFITFLTMLGSGVFLSFYIYSFYNDYKKHKDRSATLSNSIAQHPILKRDSNLEIINNAIDNKLKISFNYTNREGNRSGWIVLPKELKYYKNTLCLVGYCSKINENRSFAIYRIYNLHLTELFN